MTAEPVSLEAFISEELPTQPHILGGGLLYERTKAIVYGKYKSLKSMAIMDLAFCLATGRDWIGFDVPIEGKSVLYLQLEIPYKLLQRRVKKAWAFRASRMTLVKPLHFWTQHFLKLDQPAGLAILRKQLSLIKPDVLLVDPLYKVVSGNILSPMDSQNIIDGFDRLIEEFGLSIVIVSHTRKAIMDMAEWGSDDLIGSSFFSAWADSIIKIERRGNDRLQFKFDVVRHAEEELEPIEVLFNRDTLMLSVVQPVISLGKNEYKEVTPSGTGTIQAQPGDTPIRDTPTEVQGSTEGLHG